MSRLQLGGFLLSSGFLPIADHRISEHRRDLFEIQALCLRHKEQVEEATNNTRHDEYDIISLMHQLLKPHETPSKLQASQPFVKEKGNLLPSNAVKSQRAHLGERNTDTIANKI